MASKFIQWARTRSYKITWIALASAGALFLLMGGIFAITQNNVAATGISIQASGAVRHGNTYFMDVVAMETSIRVNTTPNNTTTNPVTFTVAPASIGLVHVTPMIHSGTSAVLTLGTDGDGLPFFGQTANILVSCGTESVELRVNIVLSTSQVEFRQTLERNTGVAWLPAFNHDRNRFELSFTDYMLSQPNNRNYRFRISFHVFGIQVFSNVTTPQAFLERDLAEWESGISMLGNGDRVYLPEWMWAETVDPHRFSFTVSFKDRPFTTHFDLHVVE